MKSVLISIRPKWCDLIASGRKTIEVQKTRPKIKPPFKCFIYCTQIKDHKRYADEFDVPITTGKWCGNGKVIGEFVCDRISMNLEGYKNGIPAYWGLEDGSCMSLDELNKYGKYKFLFGWHISDLVIYDKPKKLSAFRHCGENYHDNVSVMSRPPRSWCYAEEFSNDTASIAVRIWNGVTKND